MPILKITGNKRLNGEIRVQGAKNSVLPVLAGTLLCEGVSIIHNCPALSDVDTSIKILETLGCKCLREENTVTVDATLCEGTEIPDELMREMRSSVVFLGAILARNKRAVISSPGGCELGPRPIDIHLSSLQKMGVTIEENHGFLYCEAKDGLRGSEINLSFPSVGATENIILAATLAEGTTVIHNAAKEPEISDLADFLNSAGARIYGCGSDTVEINGVKGLSATEHTIISDRIAAATYLCACAITGGKIVLDNIMPSHLIPIISVLKECGCEFTICGKRLIMSSPKVIKRIPTIRTLVHPGFPTDAGPTVIAMLTRAEGTSVFVENIFENRYRYISELNRLGAKIKTEGRVAIVEGVDALSSARCSCTDLRGGAAVAVAALGASGTTEIDHLEHIRRGYENFEETLQCLGADISLVN